VQVEKAIIFGFVDIGTGFAMKSGLLSMDVCAWKILELTRFAVRGNRPN